MVINVCGWLINNSGWTQSWNHEQSFHAALTETYLHRLQARHFRTHAAAAALSVTASAALRSQLPMSPAAQSDCPLVAAQ